MQIEFRLRLLSSYGMSFLEPNRSVFSIIFQLILLSKDHRPRLSRADIYTIYNTCRNSSNPI